MTTQINHRLSHKVYETLETQARSLFRGIPDNELQAGFYLGVEHVLRMLRNGFVTEVGVAEVQPG